MAILLLEIALIVLGFVFLILEFKLPGHFVAGAVAVACFAAFFCLHFMLGGELVVLAVALFAIGFVLLAIELLILPGHGIPGVCGVMFILAGLVLASANQLPQTTSDWEDLLQITFRQILSLVAAGIIAAQVSKHLRDIPYVNRLVLEPPEEEVGETETASLLGEIGTATSSLRPSGIAHFGDRRVDVSTEWEMIDAGTRVQVVEIDGSRVVVKKV